MWFPLTKNTIQEFKKYIYPIYLFKNDRFIDRTVVPPLISGFIFCAFSHLRSATGGKQMILLQACCQKIKSSLTLPHNAYVTHLMSSPHVDILLFQEEG